MLRTGVIGKSGWCCCITNRSGWPLELLTELKKEMVTASTNIKPYQLKDFKTLVEYEKWDCELRMSRCGDSWQPTEVRINFAPRPKKQSLLPIQAPALSLEIPALAWWHQHLYNSSLACPLSPSTIQCQTALSQSELSFWKLREGIDRANLRH